MQACLVEINKLCTLKTEMEPNFVPNINSLPAVTLTRIFKYLDHGDRLEARRICHHWNSTISNWSDFPASLSFKIRRSPAYNSFTIISKSTVPWKHILLFAFCISKSPSWYFPSNLYNSLTSLSLVDSTITWLWVKDAIGLFPNLDRLVLKCERKIEDKREGWFQSVEIASRFVKFQERIRSLELDVNNVSTLCFYLEQFTCPNSKLEELTIKSEPQETSYATYTFSCDAFSDSLYFLIQCCINTLKSLVIELDNVMSSAITKCLKRLTQEAPKLLVLTVFKIHIKCLQGNLDTLPFDANVLRAFLATQLQVQSLSCTIWNHGNYSLRSKRPLLRNLDICGHVLIDDTLRVFRKLNTLSIHLRPLPRMNAFQINSGSILSIQGTHPNLQSLSITGISYLETSTLKYNFPNLVKLVILTPKKWSSKISPDLDEFWLQSVIKNLPKLQVLKVSLYSNSDFGVSGINYDESNRLLENKDVYLRDRVQVRCEGDALSSLKCMKELSLRCSNETPHHRLFRFTDVGVRYGFNFKDLRRLEISVGYQLSNWGLMELARLNPCLENVSVEVNINNSAVLKSPVTDDGIKRFKEALPRARHDRCSVSILSPLSS